MYLWLQSFIISKHLICHLICVFTCFRYRKHNFIFVCHYNDVIMGAIASQITSLTIVYSIVYSDADQRKHQSSASLAFVRGIHRGPVNSPHKWPVTRKMFPSSWLVVLLKSPLNCAFRYWCIPNYISYSCFEGTKTLGLAHKIPLLRWSFVLLLNWTKWNIQYL